MLQSNSLPNLNRSDCYRLDRQLLGEFRTTLGKSAFPRRTRMADLCFSYFRASYHSYQKWDILVNHSDQRVRLLSRLFYQLSPWL